MKNLFTFISLLSLIACAGTPPAWWNPSGAYQSVLEPQTAAPRTAEPSLSATVTPEEEEPMEQTFEPTVDTYEEMRLTPLPETDGGDTAGPSATTAPQEEAEELDLGQTSAHQPTASKTATQNTADTNGPALPPPSVLE